MTTSAPRHILAFDDSPDVLALFTHLLEEGGYRVTTRPLTGHDLSEIESLAPDLIVLDYMWGTEDDNWSLLQMLKMNPATEAIPVVLCTGAVEEVEPLKAHLDQQGVHVMIKPFNIDDLLKVIAATIEDVTLQA